MKKFIKLLIVCVVLLNGCGESNISYEETTESDGTTVFESERGILKEVKSIPYKNISFNGENFSLESIDLYEDSSDGYIPYVITKLDFSDLSEDAFYWITKNESVIDTIQIRAYISSKKNKIEFKEMNKIYSKLEKDDAVYVFGFDGDGHFSFEDMDITLNITVVQDEKYKYKSEDGSESELNKCYEYNWRINGEFDDFKLPINSGEEIDKELRENIDAGLENYYRNTLETYEEILEN